MVLSGLMSQRVFSRAAITFVSLWLALAARAQPETITGTMPEDYLPQLKPILARLLERAPEAISREFEVLLQEVRVEDARAQRLPQVGGSFNYGFTQSATRGSTSSQDRNSGLYYNFGAGQALFHWGALKNQSEAAKLSLLAAEKSYAQFYRSISVSVRKAYLALIVEKAGLRQRRAAFELVRRDLAVADAKFADGTISAGAREGERLRVRESEYDLRRAESDFAADRRRFARLVGLAELPEEEIPTEIPAPVYSEKRATALAATVLSDNGRRTLEFEMWDLKIQEAKLGQKIAATRLLPKFGVSANYSLENNTYVNGATVQQNAVTRESIGIGGNWPIFDGFATRAAKRQALLNKRSAEHQKTVEIDRLLESVQTLERKLKSDADQLELAETRRGIATDSQNIATEQAELGNIPKGTLDNARLAVLMAETKNFEARATFFGDWCDFVAAAASDPVLNNLPARYARAKK